MNINRREFLALAGIGISSVLAGCSNNVEIEDTNSTTMTGVCYNGNVAIIIPEEFLNIDVYYEDYHRQVPAFDGNFAMFSSYDEAGAFAYEITGGNGTIYEYDGKPIEGELDITGVCYNDEVAVIIPEEYLNIDVYYEDYHRVVPAFSGNIALFPSYDHASLFASEITGGNGIVYDYDVNDGAKTLKR